MKWYKNFLNKITMYQLMLYYLRFLIAVAIILSFLKLLPFVWWHIIFTPFYLIGVCFASNQILAKIIKVKPNYESQFITAEILTLILTPSNPLLNLVPYAIAAIAAMASKYIFTWHKRHIFNPAATGVLMMALLTGQSASWWVGNVYMIPAILLGGIIMISKLRWWYLPLTFIVSYLVIEPFSLTGPGSIQFLKNPNILTNLLSPLLLFAFVMLIEPLTAPPTKKLRTYYGLIIALILVLFQRFLTIPYTLELSLVSGNLVGFFMNKNGGRTIFKLINKETVAQNTIAFWFEPYKKFQFIPGQFLEWSLPHKKPDARGSRRWFTIASSPTENKILLTTKFAEKSSSFKKALKNLETQEELTATGPDGDFVLPDDKKTPLVFIAGGIGITPFRSIIRYLLDKNESRSIIFLYSNRTASDIAFKDLLEEANKKFGMKTVYTVTDEVSKDWNGRTGYIDPKMIKEEVLDWQKRLFYVSGPEPMVETFEKMLAEMGVKNSNIKRDYFPGYTETYSK